ncbi:ribonuclease J [Culicoidibacter larvae]|uniref:Ribonuclease J n=1 Tax=Culicoidibacter larvae TaxID=2579976 RepID=A0A5R8QET9_9FIRM|nr:ribonuclease J [Culicoidibacter larvae]TLG76539.1 ribonuclease J [Culicoidibacter larvae]
MAKIKIFALGGLDENGKSMYVVEVDQAIYVLDAGLKYPEESMLGIDKVIPDITYLKENEDRIKGIFLTHAHEDHIGALPVVMQELAVPVYGTKLTLDIVEDMLKIEGVKPKGELKVVAPYTAIDFKRGQSVFFFKTTHSIPDSIGICINTKDGSIVFTGDFYFDQNATELYSTDIGNLGYIGKKGVLALLSVSRGVEQKGYAANNQGFKHALGDYFYDAKSRVIVSAFATDIKRIQDIIDVAVEYDKKVFITGVRGQRLIDISLKNGYLKVPEGTMIPLKEVERHRDDLVVIVAGNTGIPFNSLIRMSTGADKLIQIDDRDTVVIASPAITGTEVVAAKAIDEVFKTGARTYIVDKKLLNSSVAAQEDLKMLLNLMKPKYLFPVDGEYRQLIEHEQLALGLGYDASQIFIRDNGEVVHLNNGVYDESAETVPVDDVLIDGNISGDVGNVVLRDRQQLSQDGVVITVITLNSKKKRMVGEPQIVTRGFVYVRQSQELLDQMRDIVTTTVNDKIAENGLEWNAIRQDVREHLGKFLFKQTKRRPVVLTIMMDV